LYIPPAVLLIKLYIRLLRRFVFDSSAAEEAEEEQQLLYPLQPRLQAEAVAVVVMLRVFSTSLR
jgi:hypothetical protein